jgi:hypothetical protein
MPDDFYWKHFCIELRATMQWKDCPVLKAPILSFDYSLCSCDKWMWRCEGNVFRSSRLEEEDWEALVSKILVDRMWPANHTTLQMLVVVDQEWILEYHEHPPQMPLTSTTASIGNLYHNNTLLSINPSSFALSLLLWELVWLCTLTWCVTTKTNAQKY